MKLVHDGGQVNWTLHLDSGEMGYCHNMTRNQAIDAFVANWPAVAEALGTIREPDLEDLVGSQTASRVPRQPSGQSRKKGSGQRFRELMAAGASNAEALAVIRSEFPESKATLSDAAWNRAKLQKERASLAAGPQVGGDVGELL